MLTGLVFLDVHPDRVTARVGAVPLTLALWAAFAAGAWLVRRLPRRWAVPLIVAGGIAVQLAALSAPPRGSDDLYRYIWDGRVQAAGIDPYRYPPAAPQLAGLARPVPVAGARPALRGRRGPAGRPARPSWPARLHPDQPAHRAHDLPAGGRGVLRRACTTWPRRAAGAPRSSRARLPARSP